MAKKSLILSNNDGKITFSDTASVYFDDITNAITSSQIAFGQLTLPNLANDRLVGVTNGNLSNSATGITTAGALVWNTSTNNWSGSSDVVDEYIGTAGGDLSGSFGSPEGVKVINISNVDSGILSGLYGGTGASLASGKNVILKASSAGVSYLSASSGMSGSYLTNVDGKWKLMSLDMSSDYPDVRFYTSGSSGNTFTWTKPAGANFARIMLQGAGGGGGGSQQAQASAVNGGGGAGGAFIDVIIQLTNITTASITAGIGGAGGVISNNSLLVTDGGSGTASSFIANSINLTANPGTGGGKAVGSDNSNPGGTGGAAMSITSGGYSKAGGNGAAAGGTPGVTSYTAYDICGGGNAGGFYNRPTILTTISSKNFGYTQTSDGIEIPNLSFQTGTQGDSAIAVRAHYGCGGGGGFGNTTSSTLSRGTADHGGHGYVMIISW